MVASCWDVPFLGLGGNSTDVLTLRSFIKLYTSHSFLCIYYSKKCYSCFWNFKLSDASLSEKHKNVCGAGLLGSPQSLLVM